MAFDNCSKLANILLDTLDCNDFRDIEETDGSALEVRVVCPALAELGQFFSIGEIRSSRVCEQRLDSRH